MNTKRTAIHPRIAVLFLRSSRSAVVRGVGSRCRLCRGAFRRLLRDFLQPREQLRNDGAVRMGLAIGVRQPLGLGKVAARDGDDQTSQLRMALDRKSGV